MEWRRGRRAGCVAQLIPEALRELKLAHSPGRQGVPFKQLSPLQTLVTLGDSDSFALKCVILRSCLEPHPPHCGHWVIASLGVQAPCFLMSIRVNVTMDETWSCQRPGRIHTRCPTPVGMRFMSENQIWASGGGEGEKEGEGEWPKGWFGGWNSYVRFWIKLSTQIHTSLDQSVPKNGSISKIMYGSVIGFWYDS